MRPPQKIFIHQKFKISATTNRALEESTLKMVCAPLKASQLVGTLSSQRVVESLRLRIGASVVAEHEVPHRGRQKSHEGNTADHYSGDGPPRQTVAAGGT